MSMDRYEEAMSRCKQWEREHTKGYVIQDMIEFIFPELANEDEKIKRAISYAIAQVKHEDGILIDRITEDMALAWLEKQKEQSFVYGGDNYQNAKEKAWNNFLGRNPSLKESKSVYSDGFSKGYQFGIHEEKPHKWTVHDEAVRKEAIACLEKWKSIIPQGSFADYNNILGWLKEELPIHNEEQKPAEWSEEDDACYKLILKELEQYKETNPGYSRHYSGLIEWFTTRFKSLRSQPHWKPSEEQMAALKYALGDGGKFDKAALESLYNDLKKLM